VIDGIVDLSHFNASVNFGVAQSNGIVAVIHKATQGAGFADPAYDSRVEPARAAGLLWGAYHFGTGDDPVAQADFFVSRAATELLVLDFEANPDGSSMTLGEAREFVARVREATGRWPGIYGGDYLRGLAGAGDAVLSHCWLWIADYADAVSTPAGWDDWTLWQYTDAANVEGIGGCDRSRFHGSAEQLRELWNGG
jgi:lysozyme